MTKLSWFFLFCVGVLYLITANILIKVPETTLSKHPLVIYSIIVLAGLVLSLRMQNHYKPILLFILTFLMGVVLLSQFVGA